jgi:hypothetical protein
MCTDALLHNPITCGLEIDGQPLCAACRLGQQVALERQAEGAAERRRRRRAAIRCALPPLMRAWLRALIRRELRPREEKS